MLAIATCQTYPQPPDSLLPLAEILTRENIAVRFTAWQNAPDEPFLLPLCTWDYAAEPQNFARWLEESAARGQYFANPPELMRWNLDKAYLCELAACGIDVIPSYRLPAVPDKIAAVMTEQGWTEAVLKPAVGQSGKGVVKIRAGAPLPDLAAYAHGVLVQPYIKSVEAAGETSLIFFQGTFSHAVHRRPPRGEWRANSAYGVQIYPFTPPSFALAAAQTVLQHLPDMPLYARIDGILFKNRFLLSELELIEPALYLDKCTEAVSMFADSLIEWIRV